MNPPVQILAHQIAELVPYAGMTVPQLGRPLGQMQYVQEFDFVSCGVIASLTTLTLAAKQEVNLFSTNQTALGQGWSTISSLGTGLTNNTNGDRLPSNIVGVFLRTGFSLYHSVVGTEYLNTFKNDGDLSALAENLSWQYNIGDGIDNRMGQLIDWGRAGVYVGAAVSGVPTVTAVPFLNTSAVALGAQIGHPGKDLRQLKLPIILPPNIKYEFKVYSGNSIVLIGSLGDNTLDSDAIIVKQVLRGYLLKTPVGG